VGVACNEAAVGIAVGIKFEEAGGCAGEDAEDDDAGDEGAKAPGGG
jgi:hypothetical protein